MRWYFLSDKQEQIPTTEAQFSALAAQGVLRPNSMVWHDGMAEWKALGELKPELFAAELAGTERRIASRSTVSSIATLPAEQLTKRSSWLAASGIIFVLLGFTGLIKFAIDAWHLYNRWHTQQVSLEGNPSFAFPWSYAAWLVLMLLGSFLLRKSGMLLTHAAIHLRNAGNNRDLDRLEQGLTHLGKFFVQLTLLISLVVVIGLLSIPGWLTFLY